MKIFNILRCAIKQDLTKDKFIKKDILYPRRYGNVYKSGDYVIKSFSKLRPENRNEFNIISCLDHPNIIEIKLVYHEDNYFNIVMDFYEDGDTHTIKCIREKLSIETLVDMYLKFIKPIVYLHSKRYAHLDLKFENYLINKANEYILIDFEVTRKYFQDYHDLHTLEYPCGTECYMAPEVEQNLYGPTSDIYSLGCMFYILIAKKPPKKDDVDWQVLLNHPPTLQQIIIDMLQPNHKYRPTIYEVEGRLIKFKEGDFT